MNAGGLKKVENYEKRQMHREAWRRNADKDYIEVCDAMQNEFANNSECVSKTL